MRVSCLSNGDARPLAALCLVISGTSIVLLLRCHRKEARLNEQVNAIVPKMQKCYAKHEPVIKERRKLSQLLAQLKNSEFRDQFGTPLSKARLPLGTACKKKVAP